MLNDKYVLEVGIYRETEAALRLCMGKTHS
jgi:hypothetical protein